ncbi:aspartyl protease family protein [Sphingomonas sp. MMS24-JH45]
MLWIDTLQGHALVIDFDRQAMSVTPSSPRATAAAAPRRTRSWCRPKTCSGSWSSPTPDVLGKRVRVILDTGTAVSVGNSALRQLVARRKIAGEPAVFTSVLGGQVTADYVVIPEMELGDAILAGLPVAFADVPPFRAFGVDDKPALLLGMDALKMFRRVHIDFANRQLRLAMPRDGDSPSGDDVRARLTKSRRATA